MRIAIITSCGWSIKLHAIARSPSGKVVKLMDFGAFVNIMPGKDGLVHISEISDERVDSVESAYEVGQEVEVIVKKIDDQKRIDLSARVEKYLSGELSLEENKSKKFNKSKSNSKIS